MPSAPTACNCRCGADHHLPVRLPGVRGRSWSCATLDRYAHPLAAVPVLAGDGRLVGGRGVPIRAPGAVAAGRCSSPTWRWSLAVLLVSPEILGPAAPAAGVADHRCRLARPAGPGLGGLRRPAARPVAALIVAGLRPDRARPDQPVHPDRHDADAPGRASRSGMSPRLAATADERLQRAIELEAATRERDRFARVIHDSVLQVLALVQRRGAELGGEAAELGRLAGEQEAALRVLVSRARARRPPGDGPVACGRSLVPGGDVTARGARHAPGPAARPGRRGTGRGGRRGAGQRRPARRAGPGRCWSRTRRTGHRLGARRRPGYPRRPTGEAAAQGRLGVAQSIRGRISRPRRHGRQHATPGEGTEVELGPRRAADIVTAVDAAGIRVMVVDDHPMWRTGWPGISPRPDTTWSPPSARAPGGPGRRRGPARRGRARPATARPLRRRGDPRAAGRAARRYASLMLSASGEQQDVLDAVKAGATGYL